MSRNDHEKWQMDLEEYIRQGEPEQSEKSAAWKTAIGLQDVDGLKTSEYLLETAKEHIEGRIDIKTAQKRIQSYYEQRQSRTEIEDGTKEADIVSARIAELLGERTFHRQSGRLFTNGFSKISSPMQENTELITLQKANGFLTGRPFCMLRLTV